MPVVGKNPNVKFVHYTLVSVNMIVNCLLNQIKSSLMVSFNPPKPDVSELHEGLTSAKYGLRGLRLPEVILEANNQNRYCSRHEYLPTEPLTNFLSCLVLSPEVPILAQVDD